MSMTTELIKEIRSCVEYIDAVSAEEINTPEVTKTLQKAADAIEELSAKLHASQMERSSQYYHGGWIPCEERLPEDRDNVVVTCFVHEKWCAATGYHNGFNWVVSAYNRVWDDLDVLAWRPLPKPYSPNDEEVE